MGLYSIFLTFYYYFVRLSLSLRKDVKSMKKKLIYGLTTGTVLVVALAFLSLNNTTNADDNIIKDTTEATITITNENVETAVFVTDDKVGTTAPIDELSGHLGTFESLITGSEKRQFTIRSIIEDYIRFPESNDLERFDEYGPNPLITDDTLIQALPPFDEDTGEFNYNSGYLMYPQEDQAKNPDPEFPDDALTIGEAKQLIKEYKASIGVE